MFGMNPDSSAWEPDAVIDSRDRAVPDKYASLGSMDSKTNDDFRRS